MERRPGACARAATTKWDPTCTIYFSDFIIIYAPKRPHYFRHPTLPLRTARAPRRSRGAGATQKQRPSLLRPSILVLMRFTSMENDAANHYDEEGGMWRGGRPRSSAACRNGKEERIQNISA